MKLLICHVRETNILEQCEIATKKENLINRHNKKKQDIAIRRLKLGSNYDSSDEDKNKDHSSHESESDWSASTS